MQFYKHSFNTQQCTDNERITLHIWIHFDWELFLTEAERYWIEGYIRARLKASGFLCFSDYEFNSHLHLALCASGRILTVAELENLWDETILGPLGGEWRKEWLCRAGADLPKLMKSIFTALVKRFNRHIRPGRKGTMLARSYQAKRIDDEFLEKCGGNPVRSLGNRIAYVECQGNEAGTAVTPLHDSNTRTHKFASTGDSPFRSEAEANQAYQMLVGAEEAERQQKRRERDKNSPNPFQLYFATLADFCVMRSAKNALATYAKHRKMKPDDPEFLRISQTLLDAVAKARETRDPTLLWQMKDEFTAKDHTLRHIYHCLAEFIDFIAREGRPPPEKLKAAG
jgi:hypothetical protein